ncbi:hypothetical protein [Streptomyces sp. NPDC050263]|uniref:NACHT domain-containing protein n=1 Tax=Streptomyces sp. NPDC050263 TaxID=3155037 RepID=UPI00343CCDA0
MAETYPYEQLDGRRFQRLAQCLIVAENPRTQCFPLSGPDGGRDAVGLSFDEDTTVTDALIYQVKFREPTPTGTPTSDELHQWVTKNIARELPKILTLKANGAREYIFITNVAASGHPGGGLRDRMQQWAADNLPLPTRFWWRDDLDVRLTNNPHIAFRFMLFDGPSSVAAYFEGTLPGAPSPQFTGPITVSRKSPAVTALLIYLGEQYEAESVLRFKQADLASTPLLDFFVDVPAAARSVRRSSEQHSMRDVIFKIAERAHQARGDGADKRRRAHYWNHEVEGLGAAELFLHGGAFQEMKTVVLEGAPGQGKSTLTQFVGQVHRAFILNKAEEIEKLPAWCSSVDVKLPIRIELRRLATWLQGRSPWTNKPRTAESRNMQSLEAFIVDHVQHVTEGLSFTAEDLISIVTETPTILLLDGLDEVADTSLRERVVKCCERFIKRLKTVEADIQAIVTSRPIAFAKSPAFTPEEYSYFGLGDLSLDLIQQYTSSWINIRAVPDDQAQELRAILEESLAQSHVADLARNPMQLAILIWLVYVKGWSLPDKRTALYEAYMSTFLDREADKSTVVRQYRDVLLQLHGYLGWVLHARSEVGRSQDAAGDVAEEELKDLLKSYLQAQDRPTDLVDKLFHGVERVFVLVSRVQGRFEFEVQPLREFFAARYLYKTSPHSTSAFPVKGTRPERLEALIRNPYWLNVARFFCGWYDEGELADLSRRIEDLCADPEYRHTSHPSRLLWRLLGDYVTTASPRDTKQLATLLTSSLNYRLLLNESEVAQSIRSRGIKILPADAGLSSLIRRAQEIVAHSTTNELVFESAKVISSQGVREDRFDWWHAELERTNHSRAEWFRRGQICGAFDGQPAHVLVEKLNPATFDAPVWRTVATAGRLDLAAQDTLWASEYMSALGSGIQTVGGIPTNGRSVVTLSRAVVSLMRPDHAEGYIQTSQIRPDDILIANYPRVRDELKSLLKLSESLRTAPSPYTLSIARVRYFTEAIRATFGNCWAAWRVALLAGRVAWNPNGHPSFLDSATPMEDRVKTAWQQRSSAPFWRDALATTRSDGTTLAAIACLLEIGDIEVINQVHPLISARWSEMEAWQIEALNAHFWSGRHRSRTNNPKVSLDALVGTWSELPAGFSALLAPRVKVSDISLLSAGVSHGVMDPLSTSFVAAFMVAANLKWMTSRANWDGCLESIREHLPKASHLPSTPWNVTQQDLTRYENRLSEEVVREILDAPEQYPAALLSAAAYSATRRVTVHMPSLETVAQRKNWFDQ